MRSTGSLAVVSMTMATPACASRSQRARLRPFSPGMCTSSRASAGRCAATSARASAAPGGGLHHEAVAAEVLGQQATQLGLVVDDEQRRGRGGGGVGGHRGRRVGAS
jgi:hypothetical protein